MTSCESLADGAARRHLSIAGAFHPKAGSGLPEGTGTLVLLAPGNDGYWVNVNSEPEFSDGAANPVDRWSTRVIGDWATQLGATAHFPFGGPPYSPFLTWALANGRAWASPTGPLVHDTFGMMISYRGALALPERLDIPAPSPNPCTTCAEKPCLTACPVGALSAHAPYDVPVCKAHIGSVAGRACLSTGCLTRRACPVSLGAGRAEAQSAHHMAAFLGAR